MVIKMWTYVLANRLTDPFYVRRIEHATQSAQMRSLAGPVCFFTHFANEYTFGTIIIIRV